VAAGWELINWNEALHVMVTQTCYLIIFLVTTRWSVGVNEKHKEFPGITHNLELYVFSCFLQAAFCFFKTSLQVLNLVTQGTFDILPISFCSLKHVHDFSIHSRAFHADSISLYKGGLQLLHLTAEIIFHVLSVATYF
jgi:hypothetical protein